MRKAVAVLSIALLLSLQADGAQAQRARIYSPPGKMRPIPSDHYDIQTDVSEDTAREARLRLDKMFDEYSSRTADFSKPSKRRLPFFLFENEKDYLAAGGIQGSAGLFAVQGNDAKLMALSTGDARTWHTTQHEGFHQFAHLAISENLPIWVNEGLAEYFGEAIFTGDSMLSGLIPEQRRQDVVAMIRRRQYHPFREFLLMDPATWAKELTVTNYDQAWSMVHFLAEGDSGKYRKSFLAYMTALSRGIDSDAAWRQATGNADPAEFEVAWVKYWLNLPPRPTARLFSQARLLILTSFLARATAAGQRFSSLDDFAASAKSKSLRLPGPEDDHWLPLSILAPALTEISPTAPLTLSYPNNIPQVTRLYEDGTLITVTYDPKGKGRTVAKVKGR